MISTRTSTDSPENKPSALLSVEASAYGARNLQSWSPSERAELSEAIHAALVQWSADWGLARSSTKAPLDVADKGPACCENAAGFARDAKFSASCWYGLLPHYEPNGLWITLYHPAQAETSLGTQHRHDGINSGNRSLEPQAILHDVLFRDPAGASPTFPVSDKMRLSDVLSQAAWTDWCARLTTLFGSEQTAVPSEMKPSNLPTSLLCPWFGTLVLTLPWCGKSMMLLVSGEYVTRWLSAHGNNAGAVSIINGSETAGTTSSPVVPLAQALCSQAVPIRVDLLPVEIDLGALAVLRLGDVLRTTHRLDMPLIVRSAVASNESADDGLCGGFLGKQGSQLAVELLRIVKHA